ncbi:hypothetical protein PMIN04_013216 [Paraphaeosphaeria minitans]|uniref:Uncharacterized protein n=1 Tax=Paraphaeosphaeria minitans TaxID=565426 RepID=A0A9P6GBB1_9PLEO|nr:hypothetical protein PMIN01_09897 [Paraphaeosphaeria minitans]
MRLPFLLPSWSGSWWQCQCAGGGRKERGSRHREATVTGKEQTREAAAAVATGLYDSPAVKGVFTFCKAQTLETQPTQPTTSRIQPSQPSQQPMAPAADRRGCKHVHIRAVEAASVGLMRGDVLIWYGRLLIGRLAVKAGSTLGLGRRCRVRGRRGPERGKAPRPCLAYSQHSPSSPLHRPHWVWTLERVGAGPWHSSRNSQPASRLAPTQPSNPQPNSQPAPTHFTAGTHAIHSWHTRTHAPTLHDIGHALTARSITGWTVVALQLRHRAWPQNMTTAHCRLCGGTWRNCARNSTPDASSRSLYNFPFVLRRAAHKSTFLRTAGPAGEHPCRAAAKTTPRDPDGTQDER